MSDVLLDPVDLAVMPQRNGTELGGGLEGENFQGMAAVKNGGRDALPYGILPHRPRFDGGTASNG